MESWVKMIKDTPMTDPETTQLIPGELEYRSELERRSGGIPLPQELIVEMRELASQLGVASKLQ